MSYKTVKTNYDTLESEVVERLNNRNLMRNIVTPLDVKVLTPVSSNVRDEHIIKAIVTAQETIIYDVLGCKLYNDFLNELTLVSFDYTKLPDATTSVTNVDFRTLYDYVSKALCWNALLNLITPLSNALTETGLQLKSSDFSQSADMTALKYTATEYKDKSNIYTNRLRNYILSEISNNEFYFKKEIGVNGTFATKFYDFRSVHNFKNKCNKKNCL